MNKTMNELRLDTMYKEMNQAIGSGRMNKETMIITSS